MCGIELGLGLGLVLQYRIFSSLQMIW